MNDVEKSGAVTDSIIFDLGGKVLNILVCIKQVPDTTEIKIDPVTNTLIRDGVPSIVNPFDAYALEMAARIKDTDGSKVVVMSMGPDQAKKALKECLTVGADKAYLVSDRAFGGSDTLATSYILSKAVRAVEAQEGPFDVIFCGKQAIDGDTAQVGPELAEQLGYPQITFTTEVSVENGKVKAERETENGKEVWESTVPVVITSSKPAFDVRYPTVRARLAANRTTIPALTLVDVSAEAERSGLKGSPTKVKKTFVPVRNGGGIVIHEEHATDAAAKLAVILNDIGLV